MAEKEKETVIIHANIELTIQALSTIVDVSKKLAGRNEKGHHRVDTADAVSRIISRFLLETDFEEYVINPDHYT